MTESETDLRSAEVQSSDVSEPEAPRGNKIAVDDALPEHRYLNRELSWLGLQRRVLALAADSSLPLLERAKFLAIFASNLDEFYMVRVAGLKRRDEMGLSVPLIRRPVSPRTTPAHRRSNPADLDTACAGVLDSVRPALAEEGIHIVTWADLTAAERKELSTYFQEQVFPVLTPLVVDPSHPFPFVSGLSLNLAITVKSPDDGGEHFARIKVPDNVDRFRCAEGDRERRGHSPVPAHGGAHRRLPLRPVPGYGSGGAARLPDHPQRGHGGRGRPRRRPPPGARARTCPAALPISRSPQKSPTT